MKTTLARFAALWTRLQRQGDPAAWHRKLVIEHTKPRRYYHTLQHLDECLSLLDEAAARHHLRAPDLLEMALWFHDAVYDPKSSDNEEASARLALTALGTDPVTEEITRLILLTKHHSPASGPDDSWMVDIDLGIFAQSPYRVREYERQIRQEYLHVPEPEYREKRAAILQAFLERDFIYHSPAFRHQHEAAARENLAALLAELRP